MAPTTQLISPTMAEIINAWCGTHKCHAIQWDTHTQLRLSEGYFSWVSRKQEIYVFICLALEGSTWFFSQFQFLLLGNILLSGIYF